VAQTFLRACRAYRPGVYPGRVASFLAADQAADRADLTRRLLRCAPEAQVLVLPGDHADMLSVPWVEEVARQLQACLDSAAAEVAP
jgi:putative intracellular protease/amidase